MRVGIAITLLVKQPGPVPAGGGAISYHDIGDYVSRDEKLAAVAEASIENLPWQRITPNEHHDWLNQRDRRYDRLIALASEPGAIFHTASHGLVTNRDAWVYNSSEPALRHNVGDMIAFYNEQALAFAAEAQGTGSRKKRAADAGAFADKDPTRISWNRSDYTRMASSETYDLRGDMIRISLYRPFFKQAVAFDRTLNNEIYQLPRLYPAPESENVGISIAGTGTSTPFGCIATNAIPELQVLSNSKHYARWRYEDAPRTPMLVDAVPAGRISNLNPQAVARFRAALGDDLNDDDVFYYVYGILHSPDFRSTFESSLKKEKPRVPLVESRALFDAFAAAGRELCDLHVGYESVDPYQLAEEWAAGADPNANPDLLLVGSSKMSYAKTSVPGTGHGKRDLDRSRLRYNDHLTLSGIPPKAHEYVLGTRSGIDWNHRPLLHQDRQGLGHRQRPEPVGPGAWRAALHRGPHQARRHRERAHRRDRRGVAEPRGDDCAAGGGGGHIGIGASRCANPRRGTLGAPVRAASSRYGRLHEGVGATDLGCDDGEHLGVSLADYGVVGDLLGGDARAVEVGGVDQHGDGLEVGCDGGGYAVVAADDLQAAVGEGCERYGLEGAALGDVAAQRLFEIRGEHLCVDVLTAEVAGTDVAQLEAVLHVCDMLAGRYPGHGSSGICSRAASICSRLHSSNCAMRPWANENRWNTFS